MSSNVVVQSRVKQELKEQAEQVLDDMGLSTADAIRLFLQQVVNVGGLPFQPMGKRPNAETQAAMRELETDGGRRYQNADELFASWDEE